MYLSWPVRIRSFWYAVALHLLAAALLFFSFDFSTPIKPQAPSVNIVNAVAVDKAQVEKELQSLKKEEEKKKQAEQQRLKELEDKAEAEQKKAEDLKKQRLAEEKKLLEAKKKKEQEQKLREEEQKKLEQLEKEKVQAELEKQMAEEEKQRVAEEQKKKEAELKKKQEEEKAEKELQEQLAKEAAAAETEAQQAADQQLAVSLGNEIHNKIARNFNLTGLPEGLSCKLRVNLLPSGEVVNVSIVQSSGNEIFDRRAVTAAQKASPWPVPQDGDTFDRLNMRETTITFKP